MKLLITIISLILLSLGYLLFQIYPALPTTILVGTIGVFVLLTGLIAILVKSKMMVIKSIGIILAVALIGITNVGNFYLYKTRDGLNDLNKNYDTVKFNVITNKDSEFTNLEDIECKVVILKMGDTSFNDQIVMDLNSKAKKVKNMQLTDSIFDAHKLIKDNLDTVLVINEEVANSLSLETNSFEMNSKVIHTFEYKRDRDIKPVSVDTSKEVFTIFYNSVGINEFQNLQQTNKLVVINPTTKAVGIINIPDKYYVSQPCQADQKDKLSNAKAFGTECMINSVKTLFNEEINYFVLSNADVNQEEMLVSLKTNYTEFMKKLSEAIDTNIPADDLLKLTKLITGELTGWNVQTFDLTGNNEKALTPSNGQNSLVIVPQEDSLTKAKELINMIKGVE